MSTYLERQRELRRVRDARYRQRLKVEGIPDTDRHREGYYEDRWKNARDERYFVALDGEGIETERGQLYALLAASDGSQLLNTEGLRTLDMLAWLVELRREHPHAIFVSYGFGYDVNMILRDMPRRFFLRLRNRGRVRFGRYEIAHTSGKHLTVTERERGRKTVCRVYDTLGFFQQRFSSAMLDIQVIDAESAEYQFLESMKKARGGFTADDVETLIRYNDLEVQLLVLAMDKLRTALEKLELRLNAWWGAGAVATAMYQKYKVKEHLVEPPARVQMDVLSAYYGGRIEAIKAGEIGDIYAHDVNSAYPAAMADLPSLIGGEWVRRAGSEYDKINPLTLCYVRWSIPKLRIYPFPFRGADRSIAYPQAGAGWYWSCEVMAAQKWAGEYIEVHESLTCEKIDLESRPFAWIDDLYRQRKELKRQGRKAEQMVIKLGLNSLYGKCAQGVGNQEHKPPYQCYIYAGLITARTRAKLYDAAMNERDNIVGFATDGLYSKVPLNVLEGSSIGQWECAKYTDGFFLSAGIYTMEGVDGKRTNKGRGVPDKEIDWNAVRERWAAESLEMVLKYETKHFIGYREALIRGMHLHCVWEVKPKSLSALSKKISPICVPWRTKLMGDVCPSVRELRTWPVYGGWKDSPLIPRWKVGSMEIFPNSMPYEIRRELTDDEWDMLDNGEKMPDEMRKYWSQEKVTV
jgi:hypothetical protein